MMNEEIRHLREEMQRLRATAPPGVADAVLAAIVIRCRLDKALPTYPVAERDALAQGHARVLVAELPELRTVPEIHTGATE